VKTCKQNKLLPFRKDDACHLSQVDIIFEACENIQLCWYDSSRIDKTIYFIFDV